jgi:hypothetical protein
MLTQSTPPLGGGLYVIWLSDTHYYGGRAVSFLARWRRHLRRLRRGDHPNAHMQSVFNLHGRFDPEIITSCSGHEAQVEVEQAWLDEHYGKTGCLNMNPYTHGGNGPHTEEYKARMTGRKLSKAHRDACSRGQRRRFARDGGMPEETCRRMSEARKGVPMSEEARRNMSRAQKGRVITAAHREKLKAAWARRKAAGIETRGANFRVDDPPNAGEIVAFLDEGGSVRGANRRFFDDGRDHRALIKRLAAEWKR